MSDVFAYSDGVRHSYEDETNPYVFVFQPGFVCITDALSKHIMTVAVGDYFTPEHLRPFAVGWLSHVVRPDYVQSL